MRTPLPLLPTATGRDVAAGFGAALVAPVVAALAWLLGVKGLGGGLAAALWAVPVAAAAAGISLTWWVRRRGWGWADVGFTRPARSLWHLLWEIPAAILLSAMSAAIVGPLLGLSPAASRDGSAFALHPALAVATFLATVVVVPMVEEICFRRLLLGWLVRRLPVVVAVVVCGVVFGLCHVSPPLMCFVIPLGLAMTASRVWHRSLWASVLMHMANNALVTGLTLVTMNR